MENYNGVVASMDDIIDFRDKKIALVEDYLNKEDKNEIRAVATISSINPGPIKNNKLYSDISNYGNKIVKEIFNKKNIKIIEEIYIATNGGICFLYKLSFKDIEEVSNLKKTFIYIEDNDVLGRVLDLDLIMKDESISRTSLGFAVRKCLMCNNSAHLCNRLRSHKMEDIINCINQLYIDNFK